MQRPGSPCYPPQSAPPTHAWCPVTEGFDVSERRADSAPGPRLNGRLPAQSDYLDSAGFPAADGERPGERGSPAACPADEPEAEARPTGSGAGLSRRRLLGLGLGAGVVLGAGLMTGGLAVARRVDSTDPLGRPGRALELPPRIDVHHHAMPGPVRSWLAATDWPPGFEGSPFAPWSVRDALAALDEHGTELAVLSTPIPAALTPTVAHTAELARLVNDSLHGIATDHPTRFGWLARVPLLDVDDALAEIDRVYDQLHPDGVLLTTHDGDRLLGDQAFDPVMAALHARNAVVLVHPDAPPDLYPGSLPPFVVDEPTDITRAAVSLTMSGTLDRYPAIRWILADSGGAFPYLAGRLTAGRGLGYGADPATVRAAVQRFSYDTAGPMSPYATPTLLTATATATGSGSGSGSGSILYGSDSHAIPPATVADSLAQLRADPALDAVTGAAIARGNALRLFPTLHRRLTQTRP